MTGRRSPAALEENLRAVEAWERAALDERTRAERLSDRITAAAARGWIITAHVLVLTAWLVANIGLVPGVPIFDPFPFPFLTVVLSIEAIVLALFVLASQNRLAVHADKRAHLDLQIDLLAERELTAILKVLDRVSRHLGVEPSEHAAEVEDLKRPTDVGEITQEIGQIEDPAAAPRHRD